MKTFVVPDLRCRYRVRRTGRAGFLTAEASRACISAAILAESPATACRAAA